ncbi:DUF397 domain-containing protein [Kitasatospora sp. NBC_01300]|uniref:DUF397 domain-containing protein n=1 Tax=Kitasatospora sp. NBC_01300 TaxID=2903574 RepID=UPI00352E62EC|nr:DUF397 domain-containing protein [Kitasatospora sp. NBC_01300]
MTNSGWQKSSYSGSNADCVEVRAVAGAIELRESDEGEVVVRTTAHRFASFLQGAKAGEFDHFTVDA